MKKPSFFVFLITGFSVLVAALPVEAQTNPAATATPTRTPRSNPTQRPNPTDTPVATATSTATYSATQTPPPAETDTPTATSSPTHTAIPTDTTTEASTATASPTPTRTPRSNPTHRPNPTDTPVATATSTATDSATQTPPPADTDTPTATSSPTHTAIPTDTTTEASTATASPTQTPPPAETDTPTSQPTKTVRSTPTHKPQPSDTPTDAATPTAEATKTHPPVPTHKPTETPSGSTACSDGIDNDEDGAIDLDDPGCTDPSDTDEVDTAALLTLSAECVANNTDGSKTAYFTYDNLIADELTISNSEVDGTTNTFITSDDVQPPPTTFRAGLNRGAVAVSFHSDSLTWVVKPAGGVEQQAVVSGDTDTCQPTVPFTECRTFTENGWAVSLGYTNGNEFEVTIPEGDLNQFLGSQPELGRPTTFLPGSQSFVFSVPVPSDGSSLVWSLNGYQAEASLATPLCDNLCETTSIAETKSEISKATHSLLAAAERARRSSAAPNRTSRVAKASHRLMAKARRAHNQVQRLLSKIPDSVVVCTGMANQCRVSDFGNSLNSIKDRNIVLRRASRQVLDIAVKSNAIGTTRVQVLQQEANDLASQSALALASLPHSTTICP